VPPDRHSHRSYANRWAICCGDHFFAKPSFTLSCSSVFFFQFPNLRTALLLVGPLLRDHCRVLLPTAVTADLPGDHRRVPAQLPPNRRRIPFTVYSPGQSVPARRTPAACLVTSYSFSHRHDHDIRPCTEELRTSSPRRLPSITGVPTRASPLAMRPTGHFSRRTVPECLHAALLPVDRSETPDAAQSWGRTRLPPPGRSLPGKDRTFPQEPTVSLFAPQLARHLGAQP
jgi:hypothetical protein